MFQKRPSEAGQLACMLRFCSRLFLLSGRLGNARVETIKLLLSAEAPAGRCTEDTCAPLLTPGVHFTCVNVWRAERSIGRSAVTSVFGHWLPGHQSLRPKEPGLLPREKEEEVSPPARTWVPQAHRGADLVSPTGTCSERFVTLACNSLQRFSLQRSFPKYR